MSNLPKYQTSIDEHVKLSQQLLGIGGDAIIEAPAPAEKVASETFDIVSADDATLQVKLAENDEGKAMLATWTAYGEHLGNVKFAEDANSEELMKQAQEGLHEFLVETVGEAGAEKAAELHANGADPVSAFLDAHAS